jgi:hypothetical protein
MNEVWLAELGPSLPAHAAAVAKLPALPSSTTPASNSTSRRGGFDEDLDVM